MFNNPKKICFSLKFLSKQENALEKIAFSKYPKLKKLKSFLENLKKPIICKNDRLWFGNSCVLSKKTRL